MGSWHLIPRVSRRAAHGTRRPRIVGGTPPGNAMTSIPSAESSEVTAERWFPASIERVWAQCTTRPGVESWWSPEDLRTRVQRLELRPGGGVAISLRYLPAMLGPERGAAFRAAGVPISLRLHGRVREVEGNRHLVLDLTLATDRSGSGVDSTFCVDLEPSGSGTWLRMSVTGRGDPHWTHQGRTNLEAQLDRLGRSLHSGPVVEE